MPPLEGPAKTILVVGASGATGRLLVGELLNRGHTVRVVVRSPDRLPGDIRTHAHLAVIPAAILDLPRDTLVGHVRGCDAVASCLGHNLTLHGMFGPPRRLVTDSIQRLCDAVRATAPSRPVRVVLMNTAGNRNRDLDERVSAAEVRALWLLRHLLPPHADNEQAAEYLRARVGGGDAAIEWVVVRPDTLTPDTRAGDYDVHPSPTRSALFRPGVTSRANVAHFMAELIADDATWNRWKGQMPVIYNRLAA
jgi:nucleoside-diphosphate-sugar epimerase